MSAHNPIYHLKDAYYFEVPKALWRQNWQSLDDVPQFLRDGRPDITDVAEFNAAMDDYIEVVKNVVENARKKAGQAGGAPKRMRFDAQGNPL